MANKTTTRSSLHTKYPLENVRRLVGGNDAEVVLDLGLFEELFRQVLEVALGKGSSGLDRDGDLVGAGACNAADETRRRPDQE